MQQAADHIALTISSDRDIAPRTVRLRDLIELLSDLERALIATAGNGNGREQDFYISLIGIDQHIAALHFAADENVRNAAKRLATAIANHSGESLPQPATASIREIHRRATKYNWNVTINNNEFSSTIRPAMPVFTDPLLTGSTTLFGTIVSVGGRRPTAKLDLGPRRMFTADVGSKDIAKRLGKLLYRRVSLVGDASWYASSFELSRFKIRDIGPFDDSLGDAVDAFAALRSISGKRWDEVDPDAYVRAQRDEQE